MRKVLPLFALLLIACEKHEWEGIVYPKTGAMPFDVRIGRFASLEECRSAARAVLAHVGAAQGLDPDYECGRKCRPAEDFEPSPGMAALRICEETAQ